MKTSTLMHLLYLTWGSPVFGNSYPSATSAHLAAAVRQVESIYARVTTLLDSILSEGLPHASALERAEIIGQIAPKVTAFCPAISFNEITDLNRLSAAAVSLALICWADQSIDRGDGAMLAAVKRLGLQECAGPRPARRPLAVEAQARLNGLRWITHSIEQLSLPEDIAILMRCVFCDTLRNEARVRDLSRLYAGCLQAEDRDDFWAEYAQESAALSIVDVAFVYVTSAIYAIYRQHWPNLPQLRDIFDDRRVMVVMEGPCNAMIRVFDDFGDRLIDDAHYPEWGEFTLNIFNQPDERLVDAFLRRAGLQDERVTRSVKAAFQAHNEIGWAYIIQVFADLVRDRLSGLPADAWEKYGVFLTLARRMIETGYVNMLGDIELSESKPAPQASEVPIAG